MPKFNPSDAKLTSVLEYFLTNPTAHSIKDLEKNVPAAAGISGMQLKDYLTALTDDGKIRVEKIGSGNWYWCFRGDEKKQADNEREKWRKEKRNWEGKVKEAEELLEGEREKVGDEESLELYSKLTAEKEKLLKDLQAYSDNDPTELKRRVEQKDQAVAAANIWTDNIFTLEKYVKDKMGMNSTSLAQARKHFGIPEELDYVEG